MDYFTPADELNFFDDVPDLRDIDEPTEAELAEAAEYFDQFMQEVGEPLPA